MARLPTQMHKPEIWLSSLIASCMEGRPSAHDVRTLCGGDVRMEHTWRATPLADVPERLSVFKMSSGEEVHLHMKDHLQVTLVLKCNIELIKFIKQSCSFSSFQVELLNLILFVKV